MIDQHEENRVLFIHGSSHTLKGLFLKCPLFMYQRQSLNDSQSCCTLWDFLRFPTLTVQVQPDPLTSNLLSMSPT